MITLLIAAQNQIAPAQTLADSGGLPAWVWLFIIVLIILLVWWLLVRSAEHQNEIQALHEPAHISESIPMKEISSTDMKAGTTTETDDLTLLEGIGPKVSALLTSAGINTFSKLAEMEVKNLREILESAGFKFMDPETWPGQARLLAEGKMEDFNKLVGSLKGGRKK